MTIIRYKGSSIDADIKYLLKNLDERICIGSDYPEYSLNELKTRFKELSMGISLKKKQNIFYKNLDFLDSLNFEFFFKYFKIFLK